ncbi:MAG: AAA family ATPase [Alcaligenaceae bacterium]|nr:AAA family ATPase [Alcaligenaceae bacterium]
MGKQESYKAVELLVNATLEAQLHNPIPQRNNPSSLPETYDPAFICSNIKLELISTGLAKNGAGRLCLYGPPGTGKTAYGRWLAEQLDKPLILKRASDLISMWVGATEQNIVQAFREATHENAVLFN